VTGFQCDHTIPSLFRLWYEMAEKKPVTRETRPHDLSFVLKDAPPGAWVALSRDKKRIVGTGNTMTSATLQAQLNNEDRPILIRTPLEDEGIAAGVR
jgi:hypothetical protein